MENELQGLKEENQKLRALLNLIRDYLAQDPCLSCDRAMIYDIDKVQGEPACRYMDDHWPEIMAEFDAHHKQYYLDAPYKRAAVYVVLPPDGVPVVGYASDTFAARDLVKRAYPSYPCHIRSITGNSPSVLD